jgi:hypothetical protein
MTQKEVEDLMLNMMSNREDVLQSLVRSLAAVQRIDQGSAKVVKNWDEYAKNPANAMKQLKTAIKSNQQLAAVLQQVLLTQLLYVGGDQFRTDAAVGLTKLGRGQDAIKAMFDAKLNGR